MCDQHETSDSSEVANLMTKLQALPQRIRDAYKDLSFTADGKGKHIYPGDLLFRAILKRTHDLIWGVNALLKEDNWNAAATLVRPILDCCLVAVTFAVQKEPGRLELHLMKGKKLSDFVDDNKKQLTDKQMREYLENHFPDTHSFYKEAAEYVHFSGKHVFSSIVKVSNSGSFTSFIGEASPEWTKEHKLNLANAVLEMGKWILYVTKGLSSLHEMWESERQRQDSN